MGHLHTCGLALERSFEGRGLDSGDLFGVDGGNGSGDLFLALNPIPNHHRLVQKHRVFAKADVQGLGFSGVDVDSLHRVEVADEGER